MEYLLWSCVILAPAAYPCSSSAKCSRRETCCGCPLFFLRPASIGTYLPYLSQLGTERVQLLVRPGAGALARWTPSMLSMSTIDGRWPVHRYNAAEKETAYVRQLYLTQLHLGLSFSTAPNGPTIYFHCSSVTYRIWRFRHRLQPPYQERNENIAMSIHQPFCLW